MPKVEGSVTISDFPGLVSRPDSLDIPAGAAIVQVNVQSSRLAELSTRHGYAKIVFEEE